MDFVTKFYNIINFGVCATGTSFWWACAKQSMWQVAISLFCLFFEIVWHFIFSIIIGFLIVITLITFIYMYKKIKTLSDHLTLNQSQSQSTHVHVQGVEKPKVQFNNNPNTQKTPSLVPLPIITIDSKQSNINNKVPRPPHIVQQEELIYHQDLVGGVYDEESDTEVSHKPTTSYKANRSRRSLPQTRQYYEVESEDDVEYRAPVQQRRKSTGASMTKKQQHQNQRNRHRSWERANGMRLTRTSPERRTSGSEEMNSVQQAYPVSSPNRSMNDNQREQQKTVVIQASSPINYPPPSKFNKSMNVKDWINSMDVYIEICNIRDKKKTMYWAYLDDTTQKMLRDMTFGDNDEVAVNELKVKLVELFGKIPLSVHEQMKMFNNCTQDVNENVRVFENRLESLCKKAFPNQLNYEEYIIDQFINGVLNKKLQHDMMTTRPNSVSEMIVMATKYEEAYVKQQKYRDETNSKSSKQPSVQPPHNNWTQQPQTNQRPSNQTPPNQTPPNSSNNQRFNFNSAIGNYNQNNGNSQQDLRRANQPLQSQRTPSQNRQSQDVRKCFRCSSTDHLIGQCPQTSTSSTVAVQQSTVPIHHV